MTFGFHATALLDVLGQRAALRALPSRPATLVSRGELERALRESVGRVMAFRDQLRMFIEAFSLGVTGSRLIMRGFSDSTLVSASLVATDDLLVATQRLLGVMAGCAASLVTSLAAGIAVRGGLTVGSALELPDGEIYGPVLADVHGLEQAAGGPRVIVGQGLVEMIADAANERRAREVALLAESLVFVDADGRSALDFLGDGAKRIFKHAGPNAVDVRSIRAFAEREAKQAGSAGDGKVADRYRALEAYVRAREHLWGPAAE